MTAVAGPPAESPSAIQSLIKSRIAALALAGNAESEREMAELRAFIECPAGLPLKGRALVAFGCVALLELVAIPPISRRLSTPTIDPVALHIDVATAAYMACVDDHLSSAGAYVKPRGPIGGRPTSEHSVVCGGMRATRYFDPNKLAGAIRKSGSVNVYVREWCDGLSATTPSHFADFNYHDRNGWIYATCTYGGTIARSLVKVSN